MLGLGNLSSLGIGRETTYGVPVAATHWLPFTQESFAGPRENVESGQLLGDRMVQTLALGIKQCQGGFTLENDCASFGQPLKFWNGDDGYSVANASTLNTILATAPTHAAAGSGGTIPAGNYYYKVSLLLKRTIDLFYVHMPASASTTVRAVTLGQNVTLTLGANISTFTPPLGFQVAGIIVWRTDTDGTAGTETLYDYVLATSLTTYVDDGTPTNLTAPDPTVSPFATATNLYRHRFIGATPTSGTEPLASFTTVINKDNDKAEQYDGCRMNEFNIGASGGNSPTNTQFTALGRNVLTIPGQTPSYTNLQQVLGWKTAAFVDDGSSCTLIEAFDLKCTNSCEAVPGFCATPFNRDVASGQRKVTGTIKRNFDDHTFFDKVQLGQEFGLKFNMYGQSVVTGSTLLNLSHGIDAIPFPYYCEIELFRCRTGKAGGNVNGPGRIVEEIEFKAFKSTAFNTEMRITLWNTTSTYD